MTRVSVITGIIWIEQRCTNPETGQPDVPSGGTKDDEASRRPLAADAAPGRYRTRRRVERACELLRSANLTVTEICYLVGFTGLQRTV
jgi:methylphosphotriester-DNA--protein-cysteine methyltransferase